MENEENSNKQISERVSEQVEPRMKHGIIISEEYIKKRITSISNLRNEWIRQNHGNYFIGQVKNFNPSKRHIGRAGIIPYMFIGKKVYFLMGIDHFSKDFTDFGGGVSAEDKTPIDAAIREFNQESLCSICDITEDEIQDSYFISSNSMLIIFVMIDDKIQDIFSRFNTKTDELDNSFQEMDGIVFVDYYTFLGLIFHDVPNLQPTRQTIIPSDDVELGPEIKMFKLVSHFLSSALLDAGKRDINFFHLL